MRQHLLAARRHGHEISQTDLEEALEKALAGPERKSRRLTARRTSGGWPSTSQGHALVGVYSGHAEELHKISIVPRGHAALGYTCIAGDRPLSAEPADCSTRSLACLAGRAAEEIVFKKSSPVRKTIWRTPRRSRVRWSASLAWASPWACALRTTAGSFAVAECLGRRRWPTRLQ